MSSTKRADVHECPACGGAVFTYDSGNVVPHHDGDGARCAQNSKPLSDPQKGSLARRVEQENQAEAIAELRAMRATPVTHQQHRDLDRLAKLRTHPSFGSVAMAIEHAVMFYPGVNDPATEAYTLLEELLKGTL